MYHRQPYHKVNCEERSLVPKTHFFADAFFIAQNNVAEIPCKAGLVRGVPAYRVRILHPLEQCAVISIHL